METDSQIDCWEILTFTNFSKISAIFGIGYFQLSGNWQRTSISCCRKRFFLDTIQIDRDLIRINKLKKIFLRHLQTSNFNRLRWFKYYLTKTYFGYVMGWDFLEKKELWITSIWLRLAMNHQYDFDINKLWQYLFYFPYCWYKWSISFWKIIGLFRCMVVTFFYGSRAWIRLESWKSNVINKMVRE